eukprot:1307848-Heterocapsa_arctica.AAC.1
MVRDGSVPAERQTLLDLLYAQEQIEIGTVSLRRVPSALMLADMLTKNMNAEAFAKHMVYDQSLMP